MASKVTSQMSLERTQQPNKKTLMDEEMLKLQETMDSSPLIHTESESLDQYVVIESAGTGKKWKPRLRVFLVETGDIEQSVELEAPSDGFRLKTEPQYLDEFFRPALIQLTKIFHHSLALRIMGGKRVGIFHHELIAFKVTSKDGSADHYYSMEKEREEIVVQRSILEDDVISYRWRKEGNVVKKEKREDLILFKSVELDKTLEEMFYILIQEVEKPYGLYNQNCQNFVSTLSSQISPPTNSIRDYNKRYKDQTDDGKKDWDAYTSAAYERFKSSKQNQGGAAENLMGEFEYDVFNHINQEKTINQKLFNALESHWPLSLIEKLMKEDAADPDAKVEQGKSIFVSAILNSNYYDNSLTFIDLFLSKVRKVDVADENGNTLVHHACSQDPKILSCIIRFVKKQKQSISIRNKAGDTPLHVAVKANNVKATEILIKSGADLKMRNGKNLTPYELAEEERFTDCANVFPRKKTRMAKELNNYK